MRIFSAIAQLLRRNQVLEVLGSHAGSSLWRVVLHQPSREAVCWVPLCDRRFVVPEWVPEADLAEMLDAGSLALRMHDPFASFVRLSAKAEALRKKRWVVVESVLVRGELFYLADRISRSQLIADVAHDTGAHPNAIRAAMSMYYVRGMNPLALAPQFWRCGAPGRERTAKLHPLGRPRATTNWDAQ